MKKTNFAFFSVAKRLLMPFGVFCILVLSASTADAQSFKSTTDASVSVKQAIENLQSLLPTGQTAQLSPQQTQAVMNHRVYQTFLTQAHDLNSTEAGYNAVVQTLESKIQAQTANGKTTKGVLDTSMQSLLQLITN